MMMAIPVVVLIYEPLRVAEDLEMTASHPMKRSREISHPQGTLRRLLRGQQEPSLLANTTGIEDTMTMTAARPKEAAASVMMTSVSSPQTRKPHF